MIILSNELLQQLLNEVKSINTKVLSIEETQKQIQLDIKTLKTDVKELKQGQQEIKDHFIQLDTKNADRHREINHKIDNLSKDISTVEIVTSKNWNDIAHLKSIK